MKKNHLGKVLYLFVFFLSLQISCTKKEIKSSKNNSELFDQKKLTEIVKNYIPTTSESPLIKSDKEILLASTSVSSSALNVVPAIVASCGGSFGRSYSGGISYYTYPQDTIDVTSTVEGSTINVSVSSFDVPNKFTIYNSSGTIVAISPWMGLTTTYGPWGPWPLNGPESATLYFTRTSSSIYYLKVETFVTTASDYYSATVSCTSPTSITKTFAGTTIKYYASTGLLQFNSTTDFSKVLDTLDANYETYNANYENQYSTLTPDQLDSVDSVRNFDEFYTFRQFENLFPGYQSSRSKLEGIENTWLNNSMTGTDPDSVDQTFDDAENTVSNSNFKVIVGTVTYVLGDSAMMASSQNIITNSTTGTCFTDRHRHQFFPTTDLSRKFKLKVAINSWYVRSGAKGKVVSYKRKSNGKYKRARMKLAVYCGGTIYDDHCSQNFAFSDRKPAPTGYKNRKSLKVARHQWGTIWKTLSGQLASSFDAQNVLLGNLVLQ